MKMSEIKFPVIKGFETNNNVFFGLDELSFNQLSLGKVTYEGVTYKHLKPKQEGSFAFGGNYLDISSCPVTVKLLGCDKIKIHDYDLSKES